MASQFQLIMRSGPTPGKVHELLQDDLTIGRDISNAIVVNDPEVSRRHSRLRLQAGSYVIDDLGSTNGTFVNGQRLMGPHVLRPGEIIMLGEHIGFVFESPYEAAATMPTGTGQEAYYPPQVAQTVVAPPPAEFQPSYEQPPEYQQPYPAYSGHVPQSPEPYAEQPLLYGETEAPQQKRNWLLIGIIAMLVLLCVCVVGAVAYDYLDLYCTPPFDSFWEALDFVCE